MDLQPTMNEKDNLDNLYLMLLCQLGRLGQLSQWLGFNRPTQLTQRAQQAQPVIFVLNLTAHRSALTPQCFPATLQVDDTTPARESLRVHGQSGPESIEREGFLEVIVHADGIGRRDRRMITAGGYENSDDIGPSAAGVF